MRLSGGSVTDGDEKKTKNLRRTVFKIYRCICVSSLLLMVLEAAVFMAMVRASLILPASYAENWLSVNEEKLTQADRVEEEWMPGGCRYGFTRKMETGFTGTWRKKNETRDGSTTRQAIFMARAAGITAFFTGITEK